MKRILKLKIIITAALIAAMCLSCVALAADAASYSNIYSEKSAADPAGLSDGLIPDESSADQQGEEDSGGAAADQQDNEESNGAAADQQNDEDSSGAAADQQDDEENNSAAAGQQRSEDQSETEDEEAEASVMNADSGSKFIPSLEQTDIIAVMTEEGNEEYVSLTEEEIAEVYDEAQSGNITGESGETLSGNSGDDRHESVEAFAQTASFTTDPYMTTLNAGGSFCSLRSNIKVLSASSVFASSIPASSYASRVVNINTTGDGTSVTFFVRYAAAGETNLSSCYAGYCSRASSDEPSGNYLVYKIGGEKKTYYWTDTNGRTRSVTVDPESVAKAALLCSPAYSGVSKGPLYDSFESVFGLEIDDDNTRKEIIHTVLSLAMYGDFDQVWTQGGFASTALGNLDWWYSSLFPRLESAASTYSDLADNYTCYITDPDVDTASVHSGSQAVCWIEKNLGSEDVILNVKKTDQNNEAVPGAVIEIRQEGSYKSAEKSSRGKLEAAYDNKGDNIYITFTANSAYSSAVSLDGFSDIKVAFRASGSGTTAAATYLHKNSIGRSVFTAAVSRTWLKQYGCTDQIDIIAWVKASSSDSTYIQISGFNISRTEGLYTVRGSMMTTDTDNTLSVTVHDYEAENFVFTAAETTVPEGYSCSEGVLEFSKEAVTQTLTIVNDPIQNNAELTITKQLLYPDMSTAYTGFSQAQSFDFAVIPSDKLSAGINAGESISSYLQSGDYTSVRVVTQDSGYSSGSSEPTELPCGVYYIYELIDGIVCPCGLSEKNGAYTLPADGLAVTASNCYTDLIIDKVWDDENDLYLLRPDSVKVDIYKDGALLEQTVLSKDNGYHAELTCLPVYNSDGSSAAYTAAEEDEGTNYRMRYYVQSAVSESTDSKGVRKTVFTNTILTMTLTKVIYCEDWLEEHGCPAFVITGEESDDSSRNFSRMISFDDADEQELAASDTLTRSVTFPVAKGKYKIEEAECDRYVLTQLIPGSDNVALQLRNRSVKTLNGIISIDACAEADLSGENGTSASVSFTNRKMYWDKLSHKSSAVNSFG